MNGFRKLIQNKKYFILASLIFAVFLFAPFFQAHAASNWDYLNPFKWAGMILNKAVETAVLGINAIIAFIGGLLLVLAGWLIDLALNLNSKLLDTLTVQLGWKIVRDLANLGFVLGIIVIAFATIIRNQTYGMKQILWKFIVMAILINFSLSICGVFIDMAGVATDFFITKATDSGAIGFSSALSGAFQPQRLLEVQKSLDASLKDQAKSMLTAIASVFFVILFTFLAVIAFFALAIMLFIRFAFLAVILIVAPIAWLTWVFPGINVGGQGNLWSTWWTEFMRWVFFAPIVSFFLYLAIATMRLRSAANNWLNDSIVATSKTASAGDALGKSIFIGSDDRSFSVVVGEMVVFLMLMYMGIIAANKLGIHGALTAQKAADWGINKVKGWGVGAVKGTYGAAKDRLATAGTQTSATGEVTTGAQRLTSQLATIPGVGRLFRPMADKINQTTAETRKKISEEQKKRVSTRTEADNLNRLNSFGRAADPQKMAEAYIEAVKKGYDGEISAAQKARLDEFVGQTGKTKEMAAAKDEYRKFRAEFYDAEGKIDPQKLLDRALNNSPQKPEDAAELFKTLDKYKKLNDLQSRDPVAFRELLDKVKSSSNPEDKKIAEKILPHEAADIARASISITESDALNVNVGALNNNMVVQNLRPNVAEKILKEGSVEQRNALRQTLRSIVPANISQELERAETVLLQAQKSMKRINERGEAYKASTAGQAEIEQIHQWENEAERIKSTHLANNTVKKVSEQIADLEKKNLM